MVAIHSDDRGAAREFSRIAQAALRPVDNASLTFFRIAFGSLMAAWCWNYLTSGRVTQLYLEPAFHFTYSGFSWVTPWPGSGMYLHFLGLMVLALLIAAGWYYRLACICWAVGFTYVFLLERTNYQNHYYLIILFSWLLPCLPLHRGVSIDARRKPELTSPWIAAGVLWLIRFHVGLPYIYGGIAKLTPDWILGQPMGIFLATKADYPVLGTWLAWPTTAYIFSWYGLLFDLLVVPALLWRHTRAFAFVLAVCFHLFNSVLFDIHIFPWFMLAATTVFFSPDWPRRWLSAQPLLSAARTVDPPPRSVRWLFPAVTVYLVFHCLWPLRCNFMSGDSSWHERGHLFSWRMMLRAKEVGIGYAILDPLTGTAANVDHKQFLVAEQSEKFARDPELVRQFAHFVADQFEADTGRRPEVYAFVLASLNGRKPQLLIDPNHNLARASRGALRQPGWVLPLTETLPAKAWDIPIAQWREHVEIPELRFLSSTGNSTDSGPSDTRDSLRERSGNRTLKAQSAKNRIHTQKMTLVGGRADNRQ